MMSTALLFGQTKKTVAQDGSGDFTTVQAAIDAVPDGNTKPVIIYIKKGIYKECITISIAKAFVRFVGEDVTTTKLTFDNYASKKDSAGKAFGTTGSSSVFVNGDNISFENITFENSSGPVGQAVAVNVIGNRVAFKNCRFLGSRIPCIPRVQRCSIIKIATSKVRSILFLVRPLRCLNIVRSIAD
ncbi:MAG: pectin esterase [Ferruginibacter sp.]|nr:pectin esterase [Ferruginibacter sp.]